MLVAMLSRSEWISLGAVLIAGGALILAIFSLVLALRADARAGRAETRDDPDDTSRTVTRVKPRAEPAPTPQAELEWKTGAWARDGEGRRVYTLLVRNVGGGRADGVRIWVEDDEQEVSTPVEPTSLEPNEDWTRIQVRIGIDQIRPELRFAVSWRDREGDHRIRTELALPS